MTEDDRARQARIHHLMSSGSSLVPESLVPQGSGSKSSSPKSSASRHSGGRRNYSPSNSDNGIGRADPLPNDTLGGVGLRFAKEEILASPPAAPSSHLAQQLQLARSALDDSDFPRSASMAPHRFTVYLPHEEGSMVQIQVSPTCTAHQLVKQSLACAREENGGELPVGLIDDPWMYRVHVAEEDGEVDTDFPCCDVRMNICTLGVENFVLRDRVDPARGAIGSVIEEDEAIGGFTRPPANSIIEGKGVDHSTSDHSTSKGFSSLETDNDNSFEHKRASASKDQQVCCGPCTIQ